MKLSLGVWGLIPAAILLASTSPNGRVIETTSMSVARASHSSTLLPDGRVLIAGGFAGSGHEYAPYASTEIYNPATGRFAGGPSMSFGRSGHTATLLADGRILLAGGWTGMHDARGSADIFDPVTGLMKRTGSMTVPRAGQTATLLRDGQVLFAGGEDENEVELASAEIFDPRTGVSRPTGSMTLARGEHTATLLPDGRVLIVGGAMGRYPSETIHQAMEIYDPATGRFTAAGSLQVGRYKHAAVLLPNGLVLVVGGSDNRAWQGQFESAELIDPVARTSRLTGSMNAKRFKISGAVTTLRDGRILIAGGGRVAEIYNPATGRFDVVPGTLEAARYFSATTLLNDGKVLITGGYGASGGTLPSSAAGHMFVP